MASVKGAGQLAATGISKVDLRGLEPGSQGWEEARAAVAASMKAIGAVLIAHDALGPDLRGALFGRAMPEFFTLPLDVKQRLVSGPVNGYLGPRPSAPAYESVRIWEGTDGGSRARSLADVLWPHGNPQFCDTVERFATNMIQVEKTAGTMILESMGVGKERVDSHLQSLAYNVRLSRYGLLSEAGATTDLSMQAHKDPTLLTMVVQHEVEGLEVQVKDGSWVTVPPEPDTVALVAGELFTVLTNGRVPAGVHRVRTPSNQERLSVLLLSTPTDGSTVRPLDELAVDDGDHPLLYRPCNFSEYFDFRFAGDGRKLSDPLKAFCGAVKDS